jgi:hypothetical protein
MAAVQATPAMQPQQQQGNNANMSAQASAILPPGMTKEAVQHLYKVGSVIIPDMDYVKANIMRRNISR